MWSILVTAAQLNEPNLWASQTTNPFKCLRDTLVTNKTSGLTTTCGDLVAAYARLPYPKSSCFTHFALVSDLRIESQHQTVSPGASPSDYELQHSVRLHCRPCCPDSYPWQAKPDM